MQGVLCRLVVVSLLVADVIASNKSYFESCVHTVDCESPLLCVSYVCNCDVNRTISSNRNICLPGVKHGDPCRETGQCLFQLEDTYCGNNNTCECAPGYGYEPATSRCSIPISGAAAHGGNCRLNRQCKSGMNCPGQFCECITGLQYDRTSFTCIPIPGVKHGDPCNETDQCLLELPYSYCGNNNTCECAPGYGYDIATNTCSIVIDGVVAHGGNCRLNRQCKSGMICAAQFCECITGLQYDRTSLTCIPIPGVKHGDPCHETGQCLLELADSYCGNNNTCECAPGYAYDIVTNSCSILISGNCHLNKQCMSGMICPGQFCECITGLQYDRTSLSCIPIPGVKHGDPCHETGQCLLELADSYCGNNNTCECEPGYGYDIATNTCSILISGVVPYGGKCRVNRQCKSGMICPEQFCECKSGLQYDRTSVTCIPIPGVKHGDPCHETGQCLLELPDSYCGNNNTCECAPGYGYEIATNTCSIVIDGVVAHGGMCRLDMQCKSGMICPGQTCECRTGLQYDRTSLTCIHIPGVKHGDPCHETGQCLLELPEPYCGNNNTCECPPGYGHEIATNTCSIVIDGVVAHGEMCRLDMQCKSGMICPGQTCECRTGLQYDRTSLTCIPIPGVKHSDPCLETGQCLLDLADNYWGNSNNCRCAPGYGYDPATNSCSIVINGGVAHGGMCRLDRQCKSGMICTGLICECRTGLQYDRTSLTCIPIPVTRAPGTCSTDAHCTQYGHSVCQNGGCVCQTGYVPSGLTNGVYCINVLV